MRTLINLLVRNFHQLAEVQLDLHSLEEHQYLLLIQPMRFLNKSNLIIDNDIKMHIFMSVKMLKQLAARVLYRNDNPFDLKQNLE